MSAGSAPPGVLLGCLIALPGQAGADDPLPTMSVNDAPLPEGDAVHVKITLSAASTDDVTVKATTSGGSGYTSRDETLTIPRGQTSADFDVQTAENDLDQPDRHFTVTLSAPTNATIADGTGTETITDDDATPTLAISGPAPIDEGSDNVSVHRRDHRQVRQHGHGQLRDGQRNGQPRRQDRITRERAASSPGRRVTPATSRSSYPIKEDTLDEIDETFTVNLSGASGATIAHRHCHDDDHRRRRLRRDHRNGQRRDRHRREHRHRGRHDHRHALRGERQAGHRAVRDRAGNGDRGSPTTRRSRRHVVFARGRDERRPCRSRSRATPCSRGTRSSRSS